MPATKLNNPMPSIIKFNNHMIIYNNNHMDNKQPFCCSKCSKKTIPHKGSKVCQACYIELPCKFYYY